MPELTAEERAAFADTIESIKKVQLLGLDIGVYNAAILAVNARLLALEKLAEVSIKLRDNFEAWQGSVGTPDESGYVLENGRLYAEWLDALAALGKEEASGG